jgi:glycine/D-amino acid oxidase-like deaminating enzyme
MDAATPSNVIHSPNLDGSRAQFVVVGGGPAALHTAHRLHVATGSDARILVLTQEDAFGGLSQRSLEQFRVAFDKRIQAELVHRTFDLYKQFEHELGRRLYTPFPYVFALTTPAAQAFHRQIIAATRAWGLDSGGVLLTPAQARTRFPYLDGEALQAVALYEHCGRLHFDEMKGELMRRAERATFATGVRVERVVLERGRVAAVVTSNGRIAAEQVVVAPGAFVRDLPQLIQGNDFVRSLAERFTVTKRQLFTASIDGDHAPPIHEEAFVVSPDLAIVRFEVRNGVGTYGYARPDEPAVTRPEVDPQPDRGDLEFPAVVYDLLARCMSLYREGAGTLARQPRHRSAGYYTAFSDGMPVLGAVPGAQGLFLLAGAHHYGVMTAEGLAGYLTNFMLEQAPLPEELSIERTPSGGDSFVL